MGRTRGLTVFSFSFAEFVQYVHGEELPGQNVKIPCECKAALTLKSKHYKNVLHYLRFTGQRFGVTVSTAPLQTIITEDNKTIMNLPVYLATRENIETYYRRAIM